MGSPDKGLATAQNLEFYPQGCGRHAGWLRQELKLRADRIEGQNAISRHGPGGVIVNGVEYRHSVVVPWEGPVRAWPVDRFSDLTEASFEVLVEAAPELVIFGSGTRLRFVSPALMRGLMDRRVGIETMDTAAACRTYNVLLAEGRSVVAALLFESQELSEG
jgi:uncharacterized protein